MATRAENKRRFPRHSESVCTWLSFHNDSAAYGSVTMDLGVGGARFSVCRRVEKGENVLITIQLEPVLVQCKGKVCWSAIQPDGLYSFGVRFLDLREDERDILNRFLGTQSLPAELVTI